jgi:hypothetical protein
MSANVSHRPERSPLLSHNDHGLLAQGGPTGHLQCAASATEPFCSLSMDRRISISEREKRQAPRTGMNHSAT